MPEKTRTKNITIQQQEKLLRLLKFLIKFNLLAIPIWIILFLNIQLTPLKEITAAIIFGFLQILGIPATLNGTLLTLQAIDGTFAAQILWICIGWESMYILFALIFATDFSLSRKVSGLVFLPIIYGINILRIVFILSFIVIFGSTYFDLLHTIWSFIFAALLLMFWFYWMRNSRLSLQKKSIQGLRLQRSQAKPRKK